MCNNAVCIYETPSPRLIHHYLTKWRSLNVINSLNKTPMMLPMIWLLSTGLSQPFIGLTSYRISAIHRQPLLLKCNQFWSLIIGLFVYIPFFEHQRNDLLRHKEKNCHKAPFSDTSYSYTWKYVKGIIILV